MCSRIVGMSAKRQNIDYPCSEKKRISAMKLIPVSNLIHNGRKMNMLVWYFLPKFWVRWPFGSGGEVQNRLSRWLPRLQSWISDLNGLAIFDLQVARYFLPSFESTGLSVQEKKRKISFRSKLFLNLQVVPILPTKFRFIWRFGKE